MSRKATEELAVRQGLKSKNEPTMPEAEAHPPGSFSLTQSGTFKGPEVHESPSWLWHEW